LRNFHFYLICLINLQFREIDLKQFAMCQGYRTENQLSYFKKCSDHHKAWDSVCNIYRNAMSLELMWPYVKSQPNPSVDGYLAWVQEQQDPLYRIKYEQVRGFYYFFKFYY